MSYITEFSIDGLSGRKTPYALRLNRDVNVFFGLNGSGKTSLLKIFHSAMEGDTSGLATVPFRSARIKIHSDDFNKDVSLTLHKPRAPQPIPFDEVARFSSGVARSREHLPVPRRIAPLVWKMKPKIESRKSTKWQHLYLPTARLYTGTSAMNLRSIGPVQERYASYSEEQLDQLFAQSLEQLWYSFSTPLLAKVRQAQEAGLARIMKDVLTPATRRRGQKPQVDSDTTYRRVSTFLRRQGSPRILGTPAQFRKRYSEDPQTAKRRRGHQLRGRRDRASTEAA